MQKNVAGQKLTVYAYVVATSLSITGDAANISAFVSLDDGAVTQLTDTSATEYSASNAPGYYKFDVAQAETNAIKLLFSAKSSSLGVLVRAVPDIVYTDPPNYTKLAIDSSGGLTLGGYASGQDPATLISAIPILTSPEPGTWEEAMAFALAGMGKAKVTYTPPSGVNSNDGVLTVYADDDTTVLIEFTAVNVDASGNTTVRV